MAAAQQTLTECLQNVSEELQTCNTNCGGNFGCLDGCSAEWGPNGAQAAACNAAYQAQTEPGTGACAETQNGTDTG